LADCTGHGAAEQKRAGGWEIAQPRDTNVVSIVTACVRSRRRRRHAPLTIPTAIHKLHLLFYCPIVVRPCGDSRTDCCYHNRCLLWVAPIPSPPPHRPRPRNFLLDTPQNKRLPSWSEHPLPRVTVAFTRRLRLATVQSTTTMSRIHLDDLRELPPTSPTSSHHHACHCRAPHAL
jgi:hypothetical protein